MQKTTNSTAFIPKMYCNLFGHDYQVTKKVTHHVKEYTCSHCKNQLTTNSNGKLIELTPKFKEINAILERIHERRISRSKPKITSSSIY
jgi:transcription initiation factor IIE alpha subunit